LLLFILFIKDKITKKLGEGYEGVSNSSKYPVFFKIIEKGSKVSINTNKDFNKYFVACENGFNFKCGDIEYTYYAFPLQKLQTLEEYIKSNEREVIIIFL
jgi:hypothetical protein